MEKSEIPPYAGGRPTKLTDSLIVQFVTLISRGYSYKRACDALDVSYGGFKRWMTQGKESEEQPYQAFYAAVLRARAERTQFLYERILNASSDDWHAAAWILERTEPEEFSRKAIETAPQVHLHQHKHQHEITVMQELIRQGIVTEDQLKQIDATIVQGRSQDN